MTAGSEVEGLLDQLEFLLAQDVPEAGAIAAWKAAFDAAAARASRGDGWEDVLKRAEGLGQRLQARVAELQTRMSGLAQQHSAQEAGRRALQGYGSTNRS